MTALPNHSHPVLILGPAARPTAPARALLARQALFNVQASRDIEKAAQASLPPHTLMQRAGLAIARLATALSPHSQTIWLACGPGNNGGDGLEAALHLKQWGKTPIVTWLGDAATAPKDAALSCQRAIEAGVTFATKPPVNFDFGIDAVFGLGARAEAAPISPRLAHWIDLLNHPNQRVLAVDLPTGLNADTGAAAPHAVRAFATLSLITLKPGLFTASGRDHAGDIWLDTLDTRAIDTTTTATQVKPSAWLSGSPLGRARTHASHKGTYGDVAIVGGAPGMTGAALLAAQAALHWGAGRVFVVLLPGPFDESGKVGTAALAVNPMQPELMFRALDALSLKAMTVVCGCGGGTAMQGPLSLILQSDAHAVIDADGLNAIANDTALQTCLGARAARGLQTVLTPHPLEAARLLHTTVAAVQHNRIAAAQSIADRWQCTVVLKGSGTVVAGPGLAPAINPTGNAKLATAGTGDVLAGMVGARLAQSARHGARTDVKTDVTTDARGVLGLQSDAFQAACDAVFVHGLAADDWPNDLALTASALLTRLKT